MNNAEIVKRINSMLAQKGISKKQFYEDCDISSGAYSQWNTGKTKPTLKNLKTIAHYLDCEIGDLTDDYRENQVELDSSTLNDVVEKIIKGVNIGILTSAGEAPVDPDTAEIISRLGGLTSRQKKIFLAQLRMLEEEDEEK